MTINCLCTGILFADVACSPISHIPEPGELVQTEKIALNLGGCAANVAIGLSRLGESVALSGCIGDDSLSDFIKRGVVAPRIKTDLLQQVQNRCPGTAMHLNVAGQDRRFICTTGANDDFVFDEALEKVIQSPADSSMRRLFYLGGFFMLKNLENDKAIDFLKRAKQHNWTIILDVVLYGDTNYLDRIQPFLPLTDIFMPNEYEAEKMTDLATPHEQAHFFLDSGVKSVLITCGDRGVIFASEQESFQMGVYPTNYLSGAGAGDAFCAGFMAGLLNGNDIQNAIRWGSALGASCVRGIGTTETLFNQNELREWIETHELPMNYM
ncbi:MAG: carbohydrate kinase family protein [Thermoguttaceae bacterium]